MIVPLSGVTICAIIENPMYRNAADGVPVVSLNKEVCVFPKLTPFVNLDVDGSR